MQPMTVLQQEQPSPQQAQPMLEWGQAEPTSAPEQEEPALQQVQPELQYRPSPMSIAQDVSESESKQLCEEEFVKLVDYFVAEE